MANIALFPTSQIADIVYVNDNTKYSLILRPFYFYYEFFRLKYFPIQKNIARLIRNFVQWKVARSTKSDMFYSKI